MPKSKRTQELPTMSLADISKQVDLLNGVYFNLRVGAKKLIEVVESGSLEDCKVVIEVFNLKETIESLEPKF